MGGTSTDVALYAGAFERAFETAVAGVRMRAPMMAINTVAAGGGSILHFDGARMRVGPDSAGADPGPACYRRGGPLTVTDANVCVGKIQPAPFPADLRPERRPAARRRRRRRAIRRPGRARSAATGEPPQQVAEGFLQIAVANMATPSSRSRCRRAMTCPDFALQCFGGAGGQHACLVADALGMETRVHPPLCRRALRLRHGPRRPDHHEGTGGRNPARRRHHAGTRSNWPTSSPPSATRPRSQGAAPDAVTTARSLHLRYAGTEAALIVPLTDLETIPCRIHRRASARFGFATPDRPVVVETVAAEATLPGTVAAERTLADARSRRARRRSTASASSPTASDCGPGPRTHLAAAPATASPDRR